MRATHLFAAALVVLSLSLSGYGGIAPAVAASEAYEKGKFDLLHDWPIMPIAMMLMPDGRVLAYGTDEQGKQSGEMYYAVWDPKVGTGADAFETLPNITGTDIFCAGQALIPSTGHGLLVGGDSIVNGKRNYATADVNIFDPSTDTLISQPSMAYKRWYATAVTLPNGEHVVLGGRNDRNFAGTSLIPATVATYSPTPEVRDAGGNWRTLDSASSDFAYGAEYNSWFYPRAWLNPQGGVFILNNKGEMYNLDVSDAGTLTKYTSEVDAYGSQGHPATVFAPGRILSIRKKGVAVVVDINGAEPVISSGGTLSKDRRYGNATVLADGRVWVSGGSTTRNDLDGVVLESEIWDPNTGNWTLAASAATARLYHSTAILLPDGTVATGGGGAPGPLTQMNGEIYHPPYLIKKNGDLAFRPKIKFAPSTIGWNEEFSVQSNSIITRITLVRLGAVTHTFNNEAGFFDLPISEIGVSRTVTALSPATANIAPPGYYMLFVWNKWGRPSVAEIVQISDL